MERKRDESEFLNVGEAAAAFGMSRQRLWRAVKSGRLTVFVSGRDRRERLLRRADVEAFVTPRPVKNEATA